MLIKEIRKEHFNDVKQIFKDVYNQEKEIVSALPMFKDIEGVFDERLEAMFDKHQGLVAIEEDKVVGYLMYILGDKLFGDSQCAFVPLFAHGSIKESKKRIYQALLKKASKDWLNHQKLSWVVTLFEHDQILEKFWFKNGFGQRCADAIKKPEIASDKNTMLEIKKTNKESLIDIADLHREHNAYYQKPPTCMPGDDGDKYQELLDWFDKPNCHLWIAYDKQEAVAYMRIEDDGESFLSRIDDMMNVTGAYVSPNSRKLGIGSALLNEIQSYILNHTNKKRLGVDYESLNPLAHAFWEKHFVPYTKTLARRIDEDILRD